MQGHNERREAGRAAGRQHSPDSSLFLFGEESHRLIILRLAPDARGRIHGDTRQHQSVDAGKPFEQMQQAGMQTSQLDQIMRQKDLELLRVVEHLSKNETAIGLTLLQQQGRVTVTRPCYAQAYWPILLSISRVVE